MSIWDKAKKAAGDVVHGGEKAADSAKDAAGDAVDTARDAAGNVIDTVTGGASDAADAAERATREARKGLGAAFDYLSDESKAKLMSIFDDLKKQLQDTANAAGDAAKKEIVKAEDAAVATVKQTGRDVEAGAKKALSAELDLAKAELSTAADAIKAELEAEWKAIEPLVEAALKSIAAKVAEEVAHEGLELMYRITKWLDERLAAFRKKNPAAADAIDQVGLNLQMGPAWLMWTGISRRIHILRYALGHLRNLKPRITRAWITQVVDVIGPDMVMIDASLKLEFVVFGTSASEVSAQAPFITGDLIDELLEDALRAVGLPAGDRDDRIDAVFPDGWADDLPALPDPDAAGDGDGGDDAPDPGADDDEYDPDRDGDYMDWLLRSADDLLGDGDDGGDGDGEEE